MSSLTQERTKLVDAISRIANGLIPTWTGSKADIEFHESVIRLTKGIVTAWEKWLKEKKGN